MKFEYKNIQSLAPEIGRFFNSKFTIDKIFQFLHPISFDINKIID